MARESARRDLSIVLCGEAGQGIQTVEFVLTRVLKRSGYHVYATKEYMSRVRGGYNSTLIRVSSDRVAAYVDRIDLLIPLNKGAYDHVSDRVTEDTAILGECSVIGECSHLGEHHPIRDPYGTPLQEYESCAQELERILSAGYAQVLNLLGLSHPSRDQQ